MSRPGPRVLRNGLIAAVALLAGASGTVAAVRTMSLYERLAYGPVVIIGTCVEQGRRAQIQIDEVLKGRIEVPRIAVAYRLMNWERTSREEKIEFEIGERALMMLTPEPDESGPAREDAVYLLHGGHEGKVEIPAEGSEAFLGAVRRMLAIQSGGDQHEIWEEHRRLLGETNPLLVEAGFEEVLKFRLGSQEMLPILFDHLTNPRDRFRDRALQVIAQILESARRRGERITDTESLIERLLTVARGDVSPDVRAQAVRTLKQSGRADLREDFERVAESDPAQIVRYEAQLALLEMRDGSSR